MAISIYLLTFRDGSTYIGQTAKAVRHRLLFHRSAAKVENARGRTPITTAWRLHGEPEVRVLAIVEKHMGLETEQKAIKAFATSLNVLGAQGRFKPKSKEHRAKISAALTGRKLSDKTRAKLRAAQRARRAKSPVSAETRAKTSAAIKRHWETRRLTSAS